MQHLEIEVKFFISDRYALQRRILGLGAETKGRFFETNIRYEDSKNSLIQKKSLLRLRKDIKTTLTFKSKPSDKSSDFKIRKELEVEVNDFHTMQNILKSLGFHEEQIYEKWRETLVLQNTVFCIDTMPYGDFLEIEGTGPEIIQSAKQLGLKWEERILTNYLSIFEKIKTKFNLPFSNVTFNNFKNLHYLFENIIRSFQIKA